MQHLNGRFILHEQSNISTIVNICQDSESKSLLISEDETKTNLHTIRINSIIESKVAITTNDAVMEEFIPNDIAMGYNCLGIADNYREIHSNNDVDEGVVDDWLSSSNPSTNSFLKLRYQQAVSGSQSMGKDIIVELMLQPADHTDKTQAHQICQELTDAIWRTMLTEEYTAPGAECGGGAKRILILVNPKSGKGNAKKLMKDIVLPEVKDRGIDYDLLITRRAHQASLYVANFTCLLQRYTSIAIVSGDGLLYEIYQGLAMRSDWHAALKVPISIIPGGSGNGLARTIAHFQEKKITSETDYVKHCTLNLVDGSSKPMDMSLVRTSTGKSYLSFLSFNWGFGAEVDIESERLRFMGDMRFTVWAIY